MKTLVLPSLNTQTLLWPASGSHRGGPKWVSNVHIIYYWLSSRCTNPLQMLSSGACLHTHICAWLAAQREKDSFSRRMWLCELLIDWRRNEGWSLCGSLFVFECRRPLTKGIKRGARGASVTALPVFTHAAMRQERAKHPLWCVLWEKTASLFCRGNKQRRGDQSHTSFSRWRAMKCCREDPRLQKQNVTNLGFVLLFLRM